MTDLNTLEGCAWPGFAQRLAQARFLSDQYDVKAACCDRGKDTVNFNAWRPFRAHRVDGDPDLAQVFSSSLVSTTIRSL